MAFALTVLVSNLFLLLALMLALWAVSLLKRDAGIADILWGVGFVVVAWVSFFTTDGAILRSSLIVVLTTIW